MISYDFYMISIISNDSLWFQMISYDFQWFRMISYDCIRFHTISYDFLWFPIRNNPGTTHGRPDKIAHICLAVISYGFLWFLMIFNDSYDFLWVLVLSHDFQWLLWFLIISYVCFMLSYDFIRFHKISYDFLWFLMISYDFPSGTSQGRTTEGRPDKIAHVWFFMFFYGFLWPPTQLNRHHYNILYRV